MSALNAFTARNARMVLCAALTLAGTLIAGTAVARDPTASILVTPATPAPGEVVTFTAEASATDAEIVEYGWDLDGDDDFDDGETREVSRAYAAPGSYTVSLRVEDSDGDEFRVYSTLDVVEPVPPQPPPAPPAPPPAPQPPPPLLDPFPVVRVAGEVLGSGARLNVVAVRAPRGSRVVVSCRGRGCRQRRLVRRAGPRRRLARLEGRYRHGARLTFRITAPGRIGKYTRLVIRRGLAPGRVDRCLWPGESRPRACPG